MHRFDLWRISGKNHAFATRKLSIVYSLLKRDFVLRTSSKSQNQPLISTSLAPGQNRTDTNSLEGYGSTIELQAHERNFRRFPSFFPTKMLKLRLIPLIAIKPIS